jgi:large subunit ribosomal protein L23
MVRDIIIKPVITEKAEKLSKARNQYTFVVKRDANKVEIQKAITSIYNVAVESVNTMVIPGKSVIRNTKKNMLRGRKPAYKKAIVTLAPGDEINIFSEE